MSEYTFSSFFKERVVDQNNVSVTDINTGLNNLFTKFVANETNLEDDQLYLVSENEENYPDLVTMHTLIADPTLWWWFMMINRLDNPLKDIEANYSYSVAGQSQMRNTINDAWANTIETSNGLSNSTNRIVELN
ncbi:MAG: hypothetical protein IKO49_02015 [Bacilli bacterium]|nr:hypothetical protein [Clostridia bacterium]MBR4618056.1 hypothetical protein [Bacilli bacterium]